MNEDMEGLHARISELEQQLTELLAERDEWRSAAHIDVLTGLPNRRAFMERLAVLADRTGKTEFGLLLVDLRDLKGINHRHGMAEADNVLKHIARLLRTTLRSDDSIFIARLAGDEFAVLIQGTTEEPVNIDTIAQRVLDDVTGNYLVRPSGELIRVSVSIGGVWVREATEDFDGIYHRAALNLESAKEIHYKGETAPIVLTT